MIISEVRDKRRANFGYTAEQIITKIERDPSSVPIFKHLLININNLELERLLISIMPSRYFEIFHNPEECQDVLDIISECYHVAFEAANDEIKKKVTSNFVRILKEESEHYVITYEEVFSHCHDLEYVKQVDKNIVIEHLLSRLSKAVESGILNTLNGIGRHLEVEYFNRFIDPLVRAIVGPKETSIKNKLEVYCTKFLQIFLKIKKNTSLNELMLGSIIMKLKAKTQMFLF